MSEDYCVGLNLGDKWEKISTGTSNVTDAGFSFVSLDISYPQPRDEDHPFPQPLFLMPGMFNNISVATWKSFVVGRLNSEAVLRVEDGCEESRRLLDFELRTAKFLAFPAIAIELDRGVGHLPRSTEQLAKLIDQHYHITNPIPSSNRPTGLWFTLSLPSAVPNGVVNGGADSEVDVDDAWLTWHDLRRRFPVSRQICLALRFPRDGTLPDDDVLDRWMGEHVRCVVLHARNFGDPGVDCLRLSERQEKFLKSLFIAGCQVMVEGLEDLSWDELSRIASVVKSINSDKIDDDDYLQKAARGFVDYLQTPLQPLADHLEASTYAVFEEDPCKYAQYEKAVHVALVDRKQSGKVPPFVLMVVGAGRGPLVDASMRASRKSGIPLKLYAVEKNPNAVNVLMRRRQVEKEWKSVRIIDCDMRDWQTEEKADILVSELLGSFGDNELSPECLDGAQRFLKSDGISIPQSYTSYLSPVQSYKVYSEAVAHQSRQVDRDNPLSCMYVVHMKLKWVIAPPLPMFTFDHPNWEEKSNDRHGIVSFVASKKGVLHGFAGYFDTALYKDVTLSIHPDTHSDLLISWFSVFLPIREPVEFEAGDRIELEMWRKSSETKVWYEYRLTSPTLLDVQNKDGVHAAIQK